MIPQDAASSHRHAHISRWLYYMRTDMLKYKTSAYTYPIYTQYIFGDLRVRAPFNSSLHAQMPPTLNKTHMH